jgi:hypothetical protein
MNILDLVFIARCSTIFASELPESPTQSYTLFHHEILLGEDYVYHPKFVRVNQILKAHVHFN